MRRQQAGPEEIRKGGHDTKGGEMKRSDGAVASEHARSA